MARESVSKPEQVTSAVEFHGAPAWDGGMFQVRAGTPIFFAKSEIEIILGYVRDRMQSAAQTGLESDEAYIHALLLNMVEALRASVGQRA